MRTAGGDRRAWEVAGGSGLGEPIIDRLGKGSFYTTDLDLVLRRRAIANLALCGITTDLWVHTRLLNANDRGYECVLPSDCTGANDRGNPTAALQMILMQGRVFGTVAMSEAFIAGISDSGV